MHRKVHVGGGKVHVGSGKLHNMECPGLHWPVPVGHDMHRSSPVLPPRLEPTPFCATA